MGAALLQPIGPATEGRIAAAFATGALISGVACARILHVDVKTLRGMVRAGLINCVLTGAKGTSRAYTEADVRSYLSGPRAPVRPQEKEPSCPSISRRTRAIGTSTSSRTVIGFTEARALRRVEKLKPSKRQSASPSA